MGCVRAPSSQIARRMGPPWPMLRFTRSDDTGRQEYSPTQFVHGKRPPLTGQYDDIDTFNHQLVDCSKCERAAVFPYLCWVFSADAVRKGAPEVLRRNRARRRMVTARQEARWVYA